MKCPKCGSECELMHEGYTIMANTVYECEECGIEFTDWQQRTIVFQAGLLREIRELPEKYKRVRGNTTTGFPHGAYRALEEAAAIASRKEGE